jgi:anthranilate synthase component 1
MNIKINTGTKKILADVFTPVGIYLRLRDRFRDTILLESTDFHAAENSYSFICINAIAGIEIINKNFLEYKMPGCPSEKVAIKNRGEVPEKLNEFIQKFEAANTSVKEAAFAQGFFGYMSYDAVEFFDTIKLNEAHSNSDEQIPLIRYRLYQYVIVINHFKDELFICENNIEGIESELSLVESLIKRKDVPVYPFKTKGEETTALSDEGFIDMVKKGIESCHRGDVFQVVLSRRFRQAFTGDEFAVYRALRSINPSPYLFFFDYGDYKIMGSSPEAQLVIRKGQAILHPIAGTYKRTGDDKIDEEATERLLKDSKENAEHVMLVDLARNDLSRVCDDVEVTSYRQVQYFSHVIHLVSEVRGKIKTKNVFEIIGKTFPAGTLSGAPKYKAMQLISTYEPESRGYYGGAIGFIGLDGSCNHAIMIRSFLSRNNTLICQAGAGVVAASQPKNELQEVNNKLGALKQAIKLAEHLE